MNPASTSQTRRRRKAGPRLNARKALLLTAFVLLSSSQRVRADALTVITFDDVPAPAVISFDRYQSQGVLLSTEVGPGALLVLADNTGDTSPNALCGYFAPSDGCLAQLQFKFLSPVSFVSVFVADEADDDDPQRFELDIFDSSGQILLDFVVSRRDRTTYSFTRPTADIGFLFLTPSGEFEGIDTLTFRAAPAAVPEPGSGLLLGGALFALAVWGGFKPRCGKSTGS